MGRVSRSRVARCLLPLALALAGSTAAVTQTPAATETNGASQSAVPQGEAGVLVSVVDERGGPLPDAEVSLRFGESEERLILLTGDDGQVEIRGLAVGEWQVDVRREGFMLLNAYVLLEPGKRPKIAFSSRQRTGSYWEPLQAVFLQPGFDLTRGVASGRESVRRAQQRADKASKEAAREQRRSERAAKKGRRARVIPSEPVEPVITDLVEPKRVAKASLQGGSPTSSGHEVPKESVVEQVVSDQEADEGGLPTNPNQQDRAQPAEPLGQSEGATAEAVSKTEASAETAADATAYLPLDPAPRVLRNPNLLPAGACPECGEGEFSVAATGQAEKFQRSSLCSLEHLDGVETLAAAIDDVLVERLSQFAGSVSESNGNDVMRLLPGNLRYDLRAVLRTPSQSCQVLGVVLPKGARYIGFRYQAGERSVMAECLEVTADGGQACQVGDASWLAPPRVVRTGGVTLVLGVFENRSKRSTRLPRLVVYFSPERGWLPPSR